MHDKIIENSLDMSSPKITVTLQLDADVVEFFTQQSQRTGQELQECVNDLLQMYIDIQHKKQIKLENIEEIKRELTKGVGF